MSHRRELFGSLVAAGLQLPVPVQHFFVGEPCSFAMDTRTRLAEWSSVHGYTEQQTTDLAELVASS
jgi:hypothetical protein